MNRERPWTVEPMPTALDTTIVASRPGACRLACSPFFPGGGGQLADRGALTHEGGVTTVTGVSREPDGAWVLLAEPVLVQGPVRATIDTAFRAAQSEAHTLAHVVNALVFRHFDGALLTGAQLGADASFRIDFDLPGVDRTALGFLEAAVAEVIARDLPVRAFAMDWDAAAAEPGLFRSKFATPPRGADGTVRIVEIVGLDRQACGGTHVAATGRCRPPRLIGIDNKGRQNRRLRFAIAA